jgi:ribonuclease J
VRLLLLEGANSIGGTKIYLEDRGVGVLLDFGINFAGWGLFFEEFLRPRAGRGLDDLWKMRLIPRVEGLYRSDLIPGDLLKTYDHSLNIRALFLSHAHLDHCGLVGLVREDLSIYTSALSAAIAKAMQDTGRLEFYGEIAYYNLRGPKADDPRCLEVQRGPYRSRRVFSVLGGAPEQLRKFWQMPPNPKALEPKSTAKKLDPQPLGDCPDGIDGFHFRTFPVDHSIPGSVAFAFATEDGPVVYTGDLRLHGKRRAESLRFVAEMAREKPYLLIVEGTRLGRAASENVTEQQVSEASLNIVGASEGRLVIADFGPRSIERLQTFLEVARETRRKLLVFTKDGYLLESLAAADLTYQGLFQEPALGIFDELRLEPRGWEQGFRARYGSRLVSPDEVRKNPGGFILAFSYNDMNDLLDVDPPEKSVFIYSSSEPYGEAQRVDMWRLWNWTQFYGMDVYGFRWEGEDESGSPKFPGHLHASGHISPDDLLWLIKEVQPRYVLPVHTRNRGWFVEQLREESTKVVLTDDGQSFTVPGS